MAVFYLGGEAHCQTESFKFLLKGNDFICNSVWRRLSLKELLKTVEVVLCGIIKNIYIWSWSPVPGTELLKLLGFPKL